MTDSLSVELTPPSELCEDAVMLTFALLLATSPSIASDEPCADRAALAQPAARGELNEEQQRCLRAVVDANTPESWEAAALLWRQLHAAGVEDERRLKALRATIDKGAPRGDVMVFAAGHAGSELKLDGVEIGRAPARMVDVAAGPHLVEIVTDAATVSVLIDVVHDPQGVTMVQVR